MAVRALLSEAARAELAAAMQRSGGNEIVGLLGGHRSPHVFDVRVFWPLAVSIPARDRFAVAGAEFARAEAQLRTVGHCWLGFAHSHPSGELGPSATDRRELWRDCLQLIAVPGPNGPSLFAFVLDGDHMHTVRVEPS
jgi:proteasome lid subunit RPN8/RPN11